MRSPSSASLPCCFAVSLSTGAPGRVVPAPVICSACQMKSWRRLPSFLVRSRILACSMTVLRSPTSFWPSLDSFFEGELSGFDASAELSATSICLLEGTFPLEKAGNVELAHVHWAVLHEVQRQRSRHVAPHTLEDAKQLELVVDVGLLLLEVNRTYAGVSWAQMVLNGSAKTYG